MNKVILIGNIARSPELRQTPQGVSTARFTVAVNRRYSKDGQRQADFIQCVAWRNTAEFVSKYFTKGSGIQLCGSIQTRSWEGQDGQRHYATEVVADEVEFNGSKADRQSYDNDYQSDTGDVFGRKTANIDRDEAYENMGGGFDDEFADLDNDENLPF